MRRNRKARLGDRGFIAATLIPGLAPIFLFFFYPVIYALYVSFIKYDLTRPERNFVGFQNYYKVITSYYFWNSWRVTAEFAIASFVLVVVFAMLTALTLNQAFKGQKILQVLVLLPWAIPYVVGGSMWKWMFDATYGVLNAVLYGLGLIPSYQPWLVDPTIALILLIIAYVWSEAPLPTLLFLTGLQSVPQELYESGLVDGLNAWQRFRKITVTWLSPIILIVFIWETLLAIRQFDMVWVITGGKPGDATALISFFAWRETFSFLDFGRASALCYIIVAISIVFIYLYFRALKMGSLELKVR